MLKLKFYNQLKELIFQPPSGGCVLKQLGRIVATDRLGQPPSGGCVLKRDNRLDVTPYTKPAAFGRLCVETTVQVGKSTLAETSRLRAAVC